MAQVTMKSTKEAIFKALQAAQAELAALKGQKYDPVAEAAEAKKVSVLADANATLGSGFQQRMTDVEREITSLIRQVANIGTQRLEEFQNLEQAISILEKRLEDLTGIEAAVLDLVSVVNAKEDLLRQLDTQLTEVRNEIAKARQEWNAELAESQARARKEREIAEQEWQDEFDRKKRKAQADLEEELQDKARKHNAWIQETSTQLEAREKAIADQEEEIKNLRHEASMMEYRIKAAREDEAEKVRAQVEAEFEAKAKITEAQHKSELDTRDAKIQLLTNELQKKDLEIADLKKKLDDAYARIENIAVKQSEAARPNVITTQQSAR